MTGRILHGCEADAARGACNPGWPRVARIPVEAARNGLGWYAQAGYMIPRAPVELAARYSQIYALGPADTTSTGDRQELGGGLSWYVAGHPFKLQADYFRVYNGRFRDPVDQLRIQVQISL